MMSKASVFDKKTKYTYTFSESWKKTFCKTINSHVHIMFANIEKWSVQKQLKNFLVIYIQNLTFYTFTHNFIEI